MTEVTSLPSESNDRLIDMSQWHLCNPLINVAGYTLAIQVGAELRALSRVTLEEAESVASLIIGSCFKYKEFDFKVIEASACGNDNSPISSSASISVLAERIGCFDVPNTTLVNMPIDE